MENINSLHQGRKVRIISTAIITSKSQVTIPKKIKNQLHLKPGDMIDLEIEMPGTVKIKVQKKDPRKIKGRNKYKSPKSEGLALEEMDEGVSEYFRKKYKL